MKQIKIYKFSELSEQAKSIAIKNQQDYIRKKRVYTKHLTPLIRKASENVSKMSGMPIEKTSIKFDLNSPQQHLSFITKGEIDIEKALEFYESWIKTTAEDTTVAEIKNYLHYEEMKKACIFKVIKDTKNSTRCAGYKKENSFTKIDTLTLDKLFYVLETVKNRVCQILYKLLEGWYNQFLDEKAIIAALEMYPFTEDGISIHVNIVP